MIKLVGRIRQRLLSESKFSKYLIYAIGEIVLVVIGGLSVLQINSRNQKRKTGNLEISTLKELKASLFTDINLVMYAKLKIQGQFKTQYELNIRSASEIIDNEIEDNEGVTINLLNYERK